LKPDTLVDGLRDSTPGGEVCLNCFAKSGGSDGNAGAAIEGSATLKMKGRTAARESRKKREFGCNFCDGWRSYVCRRGNHHSRFHVLQVRAEDKALELEVVKRELEHVELGALKGNQGDQNYDLPATVDLNQYQDQAVAILREVSRDIRSGAVGEVLAAQIPEGLTPIEGPEGCRSY